MTSVVELDLSNNDLSGSIPGQLGQLQELVQLSLSTNRLNGTFPSELPPYLTNLKVLKLRGNELTGPIPNHIGMMVSLDLLDLGENLFQMHPEAIVQDKGAPLRPPDYVGECGGSPCRHVPH